jgi:hypothetical protein
MTNKFPIGSQWKTRAGHRAVVVKRYDDQGYNSETGYDGCFTTWSENLGTCLHFKCGRSSYELNREYDLIAPWQEPRRGTFWVNVYENSSLLTTIHETREIADDFINNNQTKFYALNGAKRLSCIEINWTEGMGLEK